MADRDTDILVSGGGIAGLIAAAAFGATGARVICVDPAAPVTDEGAEGAEVGQAADARIEEQDWTRVAHRRRSRECSSGLEAAPPPA